MGKRAKNYTSEFKFRIVLESFIKENVSEVARQYNINVSLLSNWRRQFTKNGSIVFKNGMNAQETKLNKKIEELENLIGKKKVEISLLKKYLGFYAPIDGN